LLDIHSAFIYYVCGYPTMQHLSIAKASARLFLQLVH